MRKKSILVLVLLAIAISVSAMAQEVPVLKRLSTHVYSYVGVAPAPEHPVSFGANAGIVIGDDAVLVVDTLVSAKDGERFFRDIRKVTHRPVKYIVNTHYHLDHSWGNGSFVNHGGTVIAQKRALEMLKYNEEALAHPETWGLDPKSLEGTRVVGPTRTFDEKMTIDLGGVKVDLLYFGPTHTKDSIIVDVPSDGICFTGDLLFTGYHPFLAEADLENWRKTLSRLELGPDRKFIPGHGPVSGKQDLTALKTYLVWFDRIATRLAAGRTATDAPEIAKQILKALPAQNRGEKTMLIEANLKMRYLKP